MKFDVVGSFLRPEKLKKARNEFEKEKISYKDLKLVEDECITELVKKQKEAGLYYFTDGEFRRATWHLDFMWAWDGVGHSKTEKGLPFHNENAMIDDTYLTGKISVKNHPFAEHFKFLKQFEDNEHRAKQTIPAPAQFYEQFSMPFALDNTKKYYNSLSELREDIVRGYKEVIKELYNAGCRTIQFDDCSWGLFADPKALLIFGTDEEGLSELMKEYLDINNAVIEGKPDDLIINTHVCRGNFHSTYAASGGYEKVADYLLAKENVDNFYLEFDDERSGGFEPLASVANGKNVVLGIITTKSAKLENENELISRISDAEKYISRDRILISPQCGFASCEIGNKINESQQWEKVKLARKISEQL